MLPKKINDYLKRTTAEDDKLSICDTLQAFGSVLKILLFQRDWTIPVIVSALLFEVLSELLVFELVKIPGQFVTALLNRDEHAFWKVFEKSLTWYAIDIVIGASVRILHGLAYFILRRNLMSAMHEKYFSNNIYYKMNNVNNKRIDNPDQRMTEDIHNVVDDVTTYILSSVAGLFTGCGYFSYFVFVESGYQGLLIVYGYACIACITNLFMVGPFTKWTIQVQKKEADFRYKHVNLRDNAESVAMYNSEAFEKTECERFFEVAIHTRYWTLFYNVLAVISDTFFNDFSNPVRYIVLSIPIIYFGSYDGVSQDSLAGTITTYASMLSHLLEVLTTCASVIFAYSRLAGSAKRVYDFMCYTDDSQKPDCNDDNSMVKYDDGILYEFERVTYSTPNNGDKLLLKDFTLKVPKNVNVLITGPSGSGKTSFLRILSKVWPIKTGILTVNACHFDILPVSSTLYMPNGRLTLKQQIIFPLTVDKASKSFDDQQIMGIIKKLSLDSVLHLCNGLDSTVDFEWAERLSLGQQQRIGFARILYHRPELALLDEATNCLSPAAEREMYLMLQKRGISYISTGNQSTLQSYHDIEIKLDGWGGYEIVELSNSIHSP